MVIFGRNSRLHYSASSSKPHAGKDKASPFEEIQNACNMCFEMDKLNVTLKRQLSSGMEKLNAALLHQIRITNNPQPIILE